MITRAAWLSLLTGTALAGLLFSPVFGSAVLVGPVLATAAAIAATTELALRWPRLAPVRPLLATAAGLLVLAETVLRPTTSSGLPTAATVHALAAGATDGWLRTLQTTWPARAEPGLVLFVPLLVLLAGVLGVETLCRVRLPLLALLPSLAVLGLSQAYHATGGGAAVAIAVGWAAAAGTVLATGRPAAGGSAGPGEPPGPGRGTGAPTAAPAAADPYASGAAGRAGARRLAVAAALVPTGLALALGAILAGLVDPAHRPAYSIKDRQHLPVLSLHPVNPLDEIATRLSHPDRVVFLDRTRAPVDRWPLVVLDGFDGSNWTTSARYQPLGQRLAAASPARAPSQPGEAVLKIVSLAPPWLPSQGGAEAVDGIDPLVDPGTGALASAGQVTGLQYRLRWTAPATGTEQLLTAALDPRPGPGALGPVPAQLPELARQAVGPLRPSFQAALQLERWLRENYQVATGRAMPTGHGYPQLLYFLTTSKRGTSEQFAAAYVVLARVLGIPARLVVGYRQPGRPDPQGSYVVRNRDVLAWPEVAVQGFGWVPLDPTASAGGSDRPGSAGLAAATAQARDRLPPADEITQVEPPKPPVPPRADPRRAGARWPLLALAPLCLIAAWLVAVPLAKRLRRWRRRRGPVNAAVVGAWLEARDILRDRGLPVSPGLSVRELALTARPLLSAEGGNSLLRLGRSVDVALWSDRPVPRSVAEDAWSAVTAVRRGAVRRGRLERLRAAFRCRGLLPVRWRG